jgi:hypothetical protein
MAALDKIKFTTANKVQFYRKTSWHTVSCPFKNQDCSSDCQFCPEPVSTEGTTYITFGCGASGMQYAIPDANFIDERNA